MSLMILPDASPSRVAGLFYTLAGCRGGTSSSETLQALVSPESLLSQAAAEDDDDVEGDALVPGAKAQRKAAKATPESKRARVASIIRECVNLRLLANADGMLTLHPDLPGLATDEQFIRELFPETVFRLVVDPANDANHDLARAIAWFLAQDPLAPPGSAKEFAAEFERTGAKRLLHMNNERIGPMFHWAVRFGFAWRLAGDKSTPDRVTPDPTGYVRRALPRLLERGETMALRKFVDRLATEAPVFEGGRFRSEMEVTLPHRDPDQLSRTTSMALLRLEEEGAVVMQQLSDGHVVLLDDGSEPVRRTHIGAPLRKKKEARS